MMMAYTALSEHGDERGVEMAKVSVIIPFYNCRYVDQAIVSALNQTYQDTEIILIDDGSTDHIDKLLPYLSKIRYIRQMNGGTAKALNHGFRVATGDYVVWLSSDDMFYPSKIEDQVRFMKERNALFSYTDYHVINDQSQVVRPHATAKFWSFRALIEAFAEYCPINGCTVMMKKDIFEKAGYFNEALIYTHDYDFWLRLLTQGIVFHFINVPLTAYRRHEQMGTVRFIDSIEVELGQVRQFYKGQLERILSNSGNIENRYPL